MASFRTTVTCPAGAGRAFAYMSAFQNIVQWDPGVVDAERMDDGPLQVGSTFRVAFLFQGRRVEVTYQVTELQVPSRVVLRAEAPGFTSTDVITVVPFGRASSVTYDATRTLHGARALADPLLQVAFTGMARRSEAGLKAALAALGTDRGSGLLAPVA